MKTTPKIILGVVVVLAVVAATVFTTQPELFKGMLSLKPAPFVLVQNGPVKITIFTEHYRLAGYQFQFSKSDNSLSINSAFGVKKVYYQGNVKLADVEYSDRNNDDTQATMKIGDTLTLKGSYDSSTVTLKVDNIGIGGYDPTGLEGVVEASLTSTK